MLPEFPVAHDAIQKVWNKAFFDAFKFSDPLVSQVPIRVQREGRRTFLGESELDYKAQAVSHKWKPEVGKGVPTVEYFGLPSRLGAEMAMAQAKEIFEALQTPTRHSGVLNKGSEPFTLDAWIERMEAINVDFDQDGMPRWPQLFGSEAFLEEMKRVMNPDAFTPEQAQRLADLVNQKRKEFDERESHRRLVD